jgi:XRE family transcriptional regulator of biofilm formation
MATTPPTIEIAQHLGRRIRRLRLERGRSMGELARRATLAEPGGRPVSSGYISLLERGRITSPSLGHIRRLAEAFGLRLEQLVEGTRFEPQLTQRELAPLDPRVYAQVERALELALENALERHGFQPPRRRTSA